MPPVISRSTSDRILEAISGTDVRTCREDDEGIIVEFSNGCFFAIYNKSQVTGDPVGGNLVAFADDKMACSLQFSNGAVIEVPMDDASFVGPEAMQFSNRAELIVVWS